MPGKFDRFLGGMFSALERSQLSARGLQGCRSRQFTRGDLSTFSSRSANHRQKQQHRQQQQQHKFSFKRFPGLCSDLFGEDFMWAAARADHATGAARRRRERRLRAYLRYARMSVVMVLAESNHHVAPRRQRMARAWEEDNELHFTAMIPANILSRRQALSTLL